MCKRLNYVDRLKGVAMLAVVSCHICEFSFSPSEFAVSDIFGSFQMPLFFFLSGFVMKKDLDIYYVKKKCVQFLLPFFIIGSLYSYIESGSFYIWMTYMMKNGYWYLLTLSMFYFLFWLLGEWKTDLKMVAFLWVVLLGCRVMPLEVRRILTLDQLSVYFPFFWGGVSCSVQ